MRIPLSGPDITAREIELVNQVLTSGYLSIGPMINRFEELMAAFVGRKYAVGVSSGTAGLHLCMRAIDLQPGDRVVTSPFSFVASANSILFERGVPEFVDIEPQTLNMDVECTRRKLEELRAAGTPARALLAVQIFGQACDMDPLLALAREYELEIIEDACESLGAEYNGRPVGTFGRAAVFAFYPNKQMTTGEGGILVTDDEGYDELFRSLRNQGRDKAGTWLNHVRLGYNYRMDELSAAVGVGQMERIQELLDKRARVAGWYAERLANIAGVSAPTPAPYTTRMSWFVYVVRLDERYNRAEIMADLEQRGVAARPYFKPIHLQPYYMETFGYRPGDFPVTERISETTVALPFAGTLQEEQVDYVCATLDAVLRARD
ncbi:MAG: DegT/DnrJ/EryC1/StrS family aminotransferase [Chloroflexi bacterium]|jgi:perosamine synthetase|nr:DegT/DnrJ/EryC1/StrS family aminotransferase [Chloroflexota bacterium]